MKRTSLTGGIVVAGAILMGGCSLFTAQNAATVSSGILPANDLAQIEATCTAAKPLLSAATGSSMPSTVSGTASFAQAYCQQLANAPAGQVPATTDTSTPSWLSGVLAAVQAAAQVAGAVLPIILPLL